MGIRGSSLFPFEFFVWDLRFPGPDMSDLGLSHIALPCTDLERTIAFYRRFAQMEVVHRRRDDDTAVAWLSDRTRPFVVVFLESDTVDAPLGPFAHLGVGVASRDEVDRLCRMAKEEGVTVIGPYDSGPPAGYYAFLKDPDGHNLEVSHGQDVEQAVAQERS